MTQSATIIEQKSSQDTRRKNEKVCWPTSSSHQWLAKTQPADTVPLQLTEKRDTEALFLGRSPSYMGTDSYPCVHMSVCLCAAKNKQPHSMSCLSFWNKQLQFLQLQEGPHSSLCLNSSSAWLFLCSYSWPLSPAVQESQLTELPTHWFTEYRACLLCHFLTRQLTGEKLYFFLSSSSWSSKSTVNGFKCTDVSGLCQ